MFDGRGSHCYAVGGFYTSHLYDLVCSWCIFVCFSTHYLHLVPMDEDGIIPEKLEEAIVARLSHKPRELSAHKPYWSMLYLISTLHNPTAACLSPGMLCICP